MCPLSGVRSSDKYSIEATGNCWRSRWYDRRRTLSVVYTGWVSPVDVGGKPRGIVSDVQLQCFRSEERRQEAPVNECNKDSCGRPDCVKVSSGLDSSRLCTHHPLRERRRTAVMCADPVGGRGQRSASGKYQAQATCQINCSSARSILVDR